LVLGRYRGGREGDDERERDEAENGIGDLDGMAEQLAERWGGLPFK
jgi:hypothetical protein